MPRSIIPIGLRSGHLFTPLEENEQRRATSIHRLFMQTQRHHGGGPVGGYTIGGPYRIGLSGGDGRHRKNGYRIGMGGGGPQKRYRIGMGGGGGKHKGGGGGKGIGIGGGGGGGKGGHQPHHHHPRRKGRLGGLGQLLQALESQYGTNSPGVPGPTVIPPASSLASNPISPILVIGGLSIAAVIALIIYEFYRHKHKKEEEARR